MKIGKKQSSFATAMVLKLWWPAIMSAIGLSIGDIADALVIGQKLGEKGLTAVSICLPLYMIINVMIYGFGTGGGIDYAKRMAEGKPEEAQRSFHNVLWGGFIIAALIAIGLEILAPQVMTLLGASKDEPQVFAYALEYGRLIMLSIPCFVFAYILNYYLTADGQEKLAAAAFIAGNIADISLNVLLVLVLDMGVRGAALSTLFGQLFTIALYLILGFARKCTSLRLRIGKIDFKEMFACFRTGFSTSVQYIGQFFFFMLVNRILIRLSGENGVAVFDVLQNTSYVVMYLCEGTVNALLPVVSTLYSEKNTSGMRKAFRVALLLTFLSVSALLLFILWKPEWICIFFGVAETKSLEIGRHALRVYCLAALPSGFAILLSAYEQARGNENCAALLTVLRKGAVLFPCVLLFASMGSSGIWWFFPATEWISLAVLAMVYRFVAPKGSLQNENRIYRSDMDSRIEALPAMMHDVEAFCEKWDISPKQQMIVNLVAEEVCSAIIREGFAHTKDGCISLTLIADDNGEFEFHIRDNAVQFNPFALKEKRMTNASDEMDISAIGIQMIRKKVKTFFYRQYQGFNTLVIRV